MEWDPLISTTLWALQGGAETGELLNRAVSEPDSSGNLEVRREGWPEIFDAVSSEKTQVLAL